MIVSWILDDHTRYFLDKYLTPGKREEGLNFVQMLNDASQADIRLIEDTIHQMRYSSFLQTSYWRLVSWQVKVNAGWRCAKCGSRYNLVAHHEDYQIHGMEHYHTDHMMCLCQKCHDRVHKLDGTGEIAKTVVKKKPYSNNIRTTLNTRSRA